MLSLLTAAVLSATPIAAPRSQVPPPSAAAAPPPMVVMPPAADPAVVVPVPDPARLAVATRIAAKLVPDGAYRSMLDGLLANMQQGMLSSMTTLPVRELAKAAGVPDTKLAGMGPATLHEVLAVLDPDFDARMRLTTTALTRALIDTMSGMEPTMREGMAIAYANRFTAAQLADIDTFFASPTGSIYAAVNLQMVNDPAFRSRMQAMQKSMVATMPAALAKATAATAALPGPRTYADLTPADKAKLATLLGVDPATLK